MILKREELEARLRDAVALSMQRRISAADKTRLAALVREAHEFLSPLPAPRQGCNPAAKAGNSEMVIEVW